MVSLFVFILIFTIVIGAVFKEEKEGAGALSGQGYAVIQYNLETIVITMELPGKSAFHPIRPDTTEIDYHLVDQECQRMIAARQPLELGNGSEGEQGLPALLRLFIGFYNALSQKFDKCWQNPNDCSPLHPLNIKISLFKLITTAIQKKLFISPANQQHFEEISYSLTFKSGLASLLISIVSENTNFVPIDRLVSFYRTITSEQYLLYLPIHLYFLYGGSLFTIQAKLFKQKMVAMVENLGKALSGSDTAVSRNIEFFKGSKERKVLLEESVKMVMLAKNKETLNEMAGNLTTAIFGSKDYLSKEDFLYQVQNKPLDPMLSIYLLLLRSEFLLFEERSFVSHLGSQPQSGTNFYATEMTKLFNKCPFNGDERCNCKKCQCVRRNRQSAKLNQEKKRNAVEQVDAMRKRIEELQEGEKEKSRKIAELQEENMVLKTLLKQIKHNPLLKERLRETIEPISKVLNNEL